MAHVLIAPQREEISQPLIFLGGPIQGTADWQSRAIRLLSTYEDICIASPRRNIKTMPEDFSDEMYYEQVEWEHAHLRTANTRGSILFWLANEVQPIPGRAYAQTTRFELGEAMAYHIAFRTKVVVGIDSNFSNRRYIRYTLAKKARDIPVVDRLEDACEIAYQLAFAR